MKRKGLILFVIVAMLATGALSAVLAEEDDPVAVEAPVVEQPTEAPTAPPTAAPTEAPKPTEVPETPAPAPVETEQPTQEPADTQEPAEQPTQEPTAAPESESTPEPAKPTEVPFEADVRIVLRNEGDIYFGDRVTLSAVVTANAKYTVVWEYFNELAAPGENPWVAVETGEFYSFDVDAASAVRVYRAVVNGKAISDEFVLPEVLERPAQTPDEEPEETPDETPDEQPAEDELPNEEPDETPDAEPNEQPDGDAQDAGSSIRIYAIHDGETLNYGDEVTLVAELSGYDNAVVELQWQTSADEVEWTDVPDATGERYTMTVTEESYTAFWRVLVTVTEILPQ